MACRPLAFVLFLLSFMDFCSHRTKKGLGCIRRRILLPFLNLPRRFSSLQVDPPALYLARIHMRVTIGSAVTTTSTVSAGGS
ncbi:hypothetical protein ABKN59_009908 [Abortiporus biennis]